MVLDESEQRRAKRRLVVDALRRIAGADEVEVELVRVAAAGLGYRNRVELSLGHDPDGRPVVGFRDARGRCIDVEECPVQRRPADDVLRSARSLLLRDPRWGRGESRRLVIRSSEATGQVLVALRDEGRALPGAERLARELRRRHRDVVGVVRISGRPGRRGGARCVTIAGRDSIDERLGDLLFRLPATAFAQVNPRVADALIAEVLRQAGDVSGRRVLDLYGGVGAYGLALGRLGAAVTVCDADADAIRCGKATARRSGCRGVEFVHAGTARFLGRPLRRPDLVVANPPRGGLDRGATAGLIAHRAPRLLLVSCDPATLARDVGRLEKGGYRLRRVIPFDMFPQTAQVETLATLTR
jgi:23S rRNA (uracil1939-C5)-methyltransferase